MICVKSGGIAAIPALPHVPDFGHGDSAGVQLLAELFHFPAHSGDALLAYPFDNSSVISEKEPHFQPCEAVGQLHNLSFLFIQYAPSTINGYYAALVAHDMNTGKI